MRLSHHLHPVDDRPLSRLIHKLRTGAVSAEALLLHDAFDIPTIGRFVLGRSWSTATPDQQKEYLKLFEALVIKMYGDRLNFYSGEGFQVKSVRPEDSSRFFR